MVRPRPRGHRQGYNFLTQLCAVKPEVPKPPLVPLQTAHKPHRLMLPRLRGHNMCPSGSYTAHTDRIASVSGAYTLIFPPSGPVTGNIGCLAELVVSRIRAHSRTIVAAAWVRVPGHRIWPRLSDAGPFIGEITRNTVASSWALQTNLAKIWRRRYTGSMSQDRETGPVLTHGRLIGIMLGPGLPVPDQN